MRTPFELRVKRDGSATTSGVCALPPARRTTSFPSSWIPCALMRRLAQISACLKRCSVLPRASDAVAGTLQLKEIRLLVDTRRVAAQPPAGADDAVAWHDDCEGIGA